LYPIEHLITHKYLSRQCKSRIQILPIFIQKPLGQEHFLLWNFVSSSKEQLQKAKSDWEEKLFPQVPGDDTYIPFPKPRI